MPRLERFVVGLIALVLAGSMGCARDRAQPEQPACEGPLCGDAQDSGGENGEDAPPDLAGEDAALEDGDGGAEEDAPSDAPVADIAEDVEAEVIEPDALEDVGDDVAAEVGADVVDEPPDCTAPVSQAQEAQGCPCGAGRWRRTAGSGCVLTDSGYWSPEGDDAQHPSGPGYTATPGSSAPMESPAGGWYAPGEANLAPTPCPAGSVTDTLGAGGATRCELCPMGHACPGNGQQQACARGFYAGMRGAIVCMPCPEDGTTEVEGAERRSRCFREFDRQAVMRPCEVGSCQDLDDEVCLGSASAQFEIDPETNLARLCQELTGGAVREHTSGVNATYCVEWTGQQWRGLAFGSFEQVTSCSCYEADN